MPITTTCPNCRQALRLADEQVAGSVRCPACQTVFAAGIDRSAPTRPAGADARAAARAKTALPGLGLIVHGLLTTLVYAGLIVGVVLAAAGKLPEVPPAVARWNDRQERELWPVIARVEVEDGFTHAVILQLLLLAVGAGVGLSVLAAGVQMRRLRGYRNAVVCSVVSLLPCTTCLWGLPFAVWALMVLFDPAVKHAFES
jgi:predicted Zn finger-like uncharacterized protein